MILASTNLEAKDPDVVAISMPVPIGLTTVKAERQIPHRTTIELWLLVYVLSLDLLRKLLEGRSTIFQAGFLG